MIISSYLRHTRLENRWPGEPFRFSGGASYHGALASACVGGILAKARNVGVRVAGASLKQPWGTTNVPPLTRKGRPSHAISVDLPAGGRRRGRHAHSGSHGGHGPARRGDDGQGRPDQHGAPRAQV